MAVWRHRRLSVMSDAPSSRALQSSAKWAAVISAIAPSISTGTGAAERKTAAAQVLQQQLDSPSRDVIQAALRQLAGEARLPRPSQAADLVESRRASNASEEYETLLNRGVTRGSPEETPRQIVRPPFPVAAAASSSSSNRSSGVATSTAPPIPPRLQALCEQLGAVDELIELDENYFESVAALEHQITMLMRVWREAAEPHDASTLSQKRLLAISTTDTVAERASSSATAGGGGGKGVSCGAAGAPRAIRDLETLEQKLQNLRDLHDALSALEAGHREMQRCYLVEQDAGTLLRSLLACIRDDHRFAETYMRETISTGDGSAASVHHRGGVPPVGIAYSSSSPAPLDAKMRESQAACAKLVMMLLARNNAIADRLKDELLWMREEVERHDLSAFAVETTLTRREVAPSSCCAASSAPSATVPPYFIASSTDARATWTEKRLLSATEAESCIPGGNFPMANDMTATAATAGPPAASRYSILLCVQVPLFPSSTAPQLPSSLHSDDAMLSSAATLTVPSRRPSLQHRSHEKSSAALASALDGDGGKTVVSVVASPARYGLVQLFEALQREVFTMAARLAALQTRWAEEKAQLQQQMIALDDYDPAIDDAMKRVADADRYIHQLMQWKRRLREICEALHRQVKVPIDEALQWSDHLRRQLLEVLRQRLESPSAATATTVADTESDATSTGGPTRLSTSSLSDGRGSSSIAERPDGHLTQLPRASAQYLATLAAILQQQQQRIDAAPSFDIDGKGQGQLLAEAMPPLPLPSSAEDGNERNSPNDMNSIGKAITGQLLCREDVVTSAEVLVNPPNETATAIAPCDGHDGHHDRRRQRDDSEDESEKLPPATTGDAAVAAARSSIASALTVSAATSDGDASEADEDEPRAYGLRHSSGSLASGFSALVMAVVRRAVRFSDSDDDDDDDGAAKRDASPWFRSRGVKSSTAPASKRHRGEEVLAGASPPSTEGDEAKES